jgi:hypothetical protein
LRWFEDPSLRQLVTAELNKGEARRKPGEPRGGPQSRHRRHHPLQLSLSPPCHPTMRQRGKPFDEQMIPQLSPLGWDHINITGDYVWSDDLAVDDEGFLPLRLGAL